MFGEQAEATNMINVELGDDFWDVSPNAPRIAEGEYIFYIDSVEGKKGANKPSFGFNFTLVPFQDAYGMAVEPTVAETKLKKYFYVGKLDTNNRIYERSQGNQLQTFLTSIGLDKNSSGQFPISTANVRGILVRGKVVHTKSLSTRENPNTGALPEVIDDNDPYSYVIFANLEDNSLRGVRDTDGTVKRVNV